MTEEESKIDVAGRRAKMAEKRIIRNSGTATTFFVDAVNTEEIAISKPNGATVGALPPTTAENKPAKKPRSDKGTHRPKPAPEGRISREQVARLDELIAAREEAKIAYLRAQEAYFVYLREITAG
jgi:hypothetical protein